MAAEVLVMYRETKPKGLIPPSSTICRITRISREGKSLIVESDSLIRVSPLKPSKDGRFFRGVGRLASAPDILLRLQARVTKGEAKYLRDDAPRTIGGRKRRPRDLSARGL